MRSELLIHWSASPVDVVMPRDQRRKDTLKPIGLWVSVGDGEDGWRAWCEGEQFNLQNLKHATEVVLTPNARVIRLSTADEIDEFSQAWLSPPPWAKDGPEIASTLFIDWVSVALAYDGILIAPYCWPRRLHHPTSWYYTWDCASGCIWNPMAIAGLKRWKRPLVPK